MKNKTDSIKDDTIKVRVPTDQKDKIKKVAKSKGMNMSEFILSITEQYIRKYEEREKFQNESDKRIELTEVKISILKKKMNLRQNAVQKKSLFKKIKPFWNKDSEIEIGYKEI